MDLDYLFGSLVWSALFLMVGYLLAFLLGYVLGYFRGEQKARRHL